MSKRRVKLWFMDQQVHRLRIAMCQAWASAQVTARWTKISRLKKPYNVIAERRRRSRRSSSILTVSKCVYFCLPSLLPLRERKEGVKVGKKMRRENGRRERKRRACMDAKKCKFSSLLEWPSVCGLQIPQTTNLLVRRLRRSPGAEVK